MVLKVNNDTSKIRVNASLLKPRESLKIKKKDTLLKKTPFCHGHLFYEQVFVLIDVILFNRKMT